MKTGESVFAGAAALLNNPRLRGAGVYLFLQLVQSAVALLFLMLYARRMAPSEYGLIATYTAFFTACGLLLFLCVQEKAYFALVGRDPDASTTVVSIVGFQLMAAAFAVPTVLLVTLMLKTQTIAGLPMFPFVFLAFVSASGNIFLTTYSMSLQAVERIRHSALILFTVFAAFSALNAVLLFTVGMKAISYVVSHASIYGIAGIAAAAQMQREHRARTSWPHVRAAVRFSLPLFVHNSAHWGRVYVDRIILSALLTTAATGLYGMAVAYSAIPLLAVEAFRLANTPRFFRAAAQPDRDNARICSVLPVSVGAIAVIATLMSIFADDAFHAIASPDYWPASAYVPLLSAVVPLYVIYVNMVTVLMYRGRTGLVGAANVSACAVGVGCGVILTRLIGVWGMIAGLVLVNLLMAAVISVLARREMKLPWRWMQPLIFCSLPLLGYADFGSRVWSLWFRIFLAIFVVLFVAAAIWRDLRVLAPRPARSAPSAVAGV